MRTPTPATFVLLLLLMVTAVYGAVPACYEARTYTQAGLGSMAYRLAQPAGGVQPGVTYPLVVVLHGNGGQGSDNIIQIGGEALFFADDARRAAYPAFVIAPQCLANDKWDDVDFFAGTQAQKPATVSQRLLIGIIDHLIASLPVAANRVKLLGFSMGGYGTWDLITRYPGRFEAAVPISGGGDPTKAPLISRTRIWAHHCPSDPIVPYRGSTDMVAALTTADYPVALLPNNGGHDSSLPLATPGLLDWLMEDSLSVRLVPASTQDVEVQRVNADPNTVPGDGNGTELGGVSSTSIEIGSTNGGSRGTCGVFPFAIPAIAPASLHTADLAFSTSSQLLGGFKLPLDIYALDDRAAASATTGDYFLGVNDPTGAVLLESLADWTPPTLIATSGLGRVALTQRLTSALQAGHAGQFLTIRVNPLSVRIGGINGSFAAGSTVFSGDSSTPPVLILLLTSGAPNPPTFTPAPGTYASAQSVTIACSTAGATIHYTTDGSTPTASSPVYTGAIAVASTTTIQAIATAPSMTNSSVASATYTITIVPPPPSTVATPTFTPTPGTFSSAQSVTIACSTGGATIHYTTDGSTPTAASTVYAGAIAVASTTTILAIATAPSMTNSSVASGTYTITIVPPPPATVATPTFTPAPGTFGSAQSVTIACSTAGATIHYTTNGSTPTTSSATYSGAISVATTTTVKAIAGASEMTDSSVASGTYMITIVPPPPATVATPTFTPALGTYSSAQSVTIACSTSGATIHYTTDGSTPTASSAVYAGAIAVASTTTIQAIATAPSMTNSNVASATYTITQSNNASTDHPFAASMDNGGSGCGFGSLSGLMLVAAMMIGLRCHQRRCESE